MNCKSEKTGFTLIEVMIVVAIIGLLAALGIPHVLHAGNSTRSKRVAREIQTAGHAFVQYAFETGDYPEDKNPAEMPEGMGDYLQGFPWSEGTAVGGNWDWDHHVFGVEAAVSVQGSDWGDERMARIDELIDDGNLGSGQFRKRANGYMYVLEELN